MSDNIFGRYQKKELINKLVKNLDINIGFDWDDEIKNNEELLRILESYDYTVLKKYYESGFNKHTHLDKIDFDLYCINNFNKKIDYELLDLGLSSYDEFKRLLKTKDDLEKLDSIINKYGIKVIKGFLYYEKNSNTNQQLNTFSDIKDIYIEEYLKDIENKDINKNNELISNYLSKEEIDLARSHGIKFDYLPNTKTFGTYFNFIKSMSGNNNGINIYLYDFNAFESVKNLFTNIELDNLNQGNKINLIKIIASYNQFNINNQEELNHFETIRENHLTKDYESNPSIITFLEMFFEDRKISQPDYNTYIYYNCQNLDKIFTLFNESDLSNKFNLSNDEIKCIKAYSYIKNIDYKHFFDQSSIEIFNYFKNQKYDFRNIDKHILFNKLRNIYGYEIISSLTQFNDLKETVMTNKHDVPVIEINSGHFKLLSHTILNESLNKRILNNEGYGGLASTPRLWDEMNDEFGVSYISTSLISDDALNMVFPSSKDVVYGFNSIEKDSIINISPSDGATSHYQNANEYVEGGGRERIYFSDELIDESCIQTAYRYNEVAIKRKKQDGSKLKPSCIIVFDNIINDLSLQHAKYHNIPIVSISTKFLVNKFWEEIKKTEEKMITTIDNKEKHELERELFKKYNKYYNLFNITKDIIKNININELESKLHELETSIKQRNDSGIKTA